MKRKYSQQQLRIIKRNYAIKAQKQDRKTILSTILNVPNIAIIISIALYVETKFFLFILSAILAGIIEGITIYNAVTRETQRISKGYF